MTTYDYGALVLLALYGMLGMLALGVLITMAINVLIERHRDQYALKYGRWPS